MDEDARAKLDAYELQLVAAAMQAADDACHTGCSPDYEALAKAAIAAMVGEAERLTGWKAHG